MRIGGLSKGGGAAEASRVPGTELSHRATPNPVSARSTAGRLPNGGQQPKDQREAKGHARDPRAFSETRMGERNSERLGLCPKATELSKESF